MAGFLDHSKCSSCNERNSVKASIALSQYLALDERSPQIIGLQLQPPEFAKKHINSRPFCQTYPPPGVAQEKPVELEGCPPQKVYFSPAYERTRNAVSRPLGKRGNEEREVPPTPPFLTA
jgi:hypothetical protein